MRIAIDVDYTITYAPEFFAQLTQLFQDAEIVIVTVREDREEMIQTLEEHRIRYNRLILLNDEEFGRDPEQDFDQWKASVVERIQADVLFEDAPEMIQHIKPPTKVFMACDEVIQEWICQSLEKK